ncbi:MAG: hypothetical protein JO261_11155, partial [Alphaproteobacteria bacterium]|nr:hypothetical protein [Alphaproteobacteria bacterium]
MFDASQFAIRPFLWSGAVMAGCMLVLPADTAPGLAMLWSLFAILVALVNVYRHGLRQGLLIPILTMLLIGMLGGPGLFGIFCIEGLLMFLASAGLVRLRPA